MSISNAQRQHIVAMRLAKSDMLQEARRFVAEVESLLSAK